MSRKEKAIGAAAVRAAVFAAAPPAVQAAILAQDSAWQTGPRAGLPGRLPQRGQHG